MTKVLIFGTFDELHAGHFAMMREAREHGDYLVAAIARDRYVREVKERAAKFNEDDRMQLVSEHPLVDEVVLSDRKRGSFEVIKKTEPDIIALGYDQDELYESLKQWLAKSGNKHIQLVRLKPFQPDKYKTSYVRH